MRVHLQEGGRRWVQLAVTLHLVATKGRTVNHGEMQEVQILILVVKETTYSSILVRSLITHHQHHWTSEEEADGPI